ncbi:MAG: archaeal proteasome endopeptidase complex subunit alpha [Candidatus Aenigmarchaeota archaeon]|nr:archaeal proteasome endopeptidase complex subunit alpha [Candidatus Aenigmarchaeota archaeon]MDW8149218.1 archaeal proteasome endopeptidase complex subunit alpha [Candidatus Aenigmarchaeota archaeon]
MVEAGLPEYMGYDRTIAMFTPDGRLLQVEYARETVKRGATIMGITFVDGVVLAATRVVHGNKLMKPTIEKLFQIDDHVVAAASGFLSDARVLIDYARIRAQVHTITYDEPENILSISKNIADRIQYSTLIAGLRPFGVGLLIAGWDKLGVHLVEVDTAGMIFEWKAHSLGRGAQAAIKNLQQYWREDLEEKEAIKLALDILEKSEKEFKGADIAVVKMNEKVKFLKEENIK